MKFIDLQEFIAVLERSSALERVSAPVDPHLEIAAIVDRYCKSDGTDRALLFANVNGSRMPLAANLFGSARRVALALGVPDVERLAQRLRDDLAGIEEDNSGRALARLLDRNSAGYVRQVVDPWFTDDLTGPGLRALPVLHAWPEDGGPYITLGQVYTRHPDGGGQNCGMYRIQVLDGHRALLRCHPGSGGAAHLAAWHARGRAMPVALSLGGPPALTWSAGASLPDDISEFDFTAYLLDQSLPVSRSQLGDLLVPATAEIVIEGHILPGETGMEGPFGNHTGYYAPASPAPVMRIESVMARPNPVYPGTLVGPPPMENAHLARAVERLLLPLLRYDHPWVADVHMPDEGIYHRAALVAVTGRQMPLHEIARHLWTSRLLRNARMLVLLDEDVDLRRSAEVYWRSINANDWRDAILVDDNRLVVDARTRPGRRRVAPDQAALDRVARRWPEFNLDGGTRSEPEKGKS